MQLGEPFAEARGNLAGNLGELEVSDLQGFSRAPRVGRGNPPFQTGETFKPATPQITKNRVIVRRGKNLQVPGFADGVVLLGIRCSSLRLASAAGSDSGSKCPGGRSRSGPTEEVCTSSFL